MKIGKICLIFFSERKAEWNSKNKKKNCYQMLIRLWKNSAKNFSKIRIGSREFFFQSNWNSQKKFFCPIFFWKTFSWIFYQIEIIERFLFFGRIFFKKDFQFSSVFCLQFFQLSLKTKIFAFKKLKSGSFCLKFTFKKFLFIFISCRKENLEIPV